MTFPHPFVRSAVALAVCFYSVLGQAQEAIGPWAGAELFAVPKHFPSDQFPTPGFQSLMYEGLDFKGKKTRFYAYYKTPEGEVPEGGWPAVVCVHGGGGTASTKQIESWVEHGYAAIAMDLEGHLPQPGVAHNKRPGHEWSGPARAGNFDSGKINAGTPVEEHWFYHAISGIVRAHSLLRSFPEINGDKIGIEGSSWGGVLTSLTIGIDPRFKFGITNTGCGFLQNGDSYLGDNFRNMSAEKREVAIGLYEPSTYIANAKLPMLWVNSPTDQHFPLDCTEETALGTSGESTLWIKVDWGHAARPGEATFAFADNVIKGTPPLAKIGRPTKQGGEWQVEFESDSPMQSAELCFTLEDGLSNKRKWQVAPANLTENRVHATLPEGTKVFFFNVVDDRGLMVSSLRHDFSEAD